MTNNQFGRIPEVALRLSGLECQEDADLVLELFNAYNDLLERLHGLNALRDHREWRRTYMREYRQGKRRRPGIDISAI